jgi:hypothetical protein
MKRWLLLQPGMIDEVLMLSDDELVATHAIWHDEEDIKKIRAATKGDWAVTYEGFAIRIADGPLSGEYRIPR